MEKRPKRRGGERKRGNKFRQLINSLPSGESNNTRAQNEARKRARLNHIKSKLEK